MPNQQQFLPAHHEKPEVYKGFEINTGQLFNGQFAYEAWNHQLEMGFYRGNRNAIIDAIDFYCSKTQNVMDYGHTEAN